jgi:hypothetical protein
MDRKKILSLSEEFIGHLLAISGETGIPLQSLYKMYFLMTTIAEYFQSPNTVNIPYKYYLYSIPESVPLHKRDNLLGKTWSRIYDLLVECYWVLIITGIVDILNILGNYVNGGIEEAINYLVHTVVYSETERKAVLIKDNKDLYEFMKEEFSVFETFFPDFGKFLNEITEPMVEYELMKQENYGVKLLIEHPTSSKKRRQNLDTLSSDTEENADTEDEEGSSEYGEPVSDRYSDYDFDNSSSYDPQEEILKAHEEDAVLHEDRESIQENEREIKRLEEPEPLSIITILSRLESHMELKALLKNYKLNGDPDVVVSYLMKIINNESRTVNYEHYNYQVFEKSERSAMTIRRWVQGIKDGKIPIDDNPDRLGEISTINDFSLVEINELKTMMDARQRHHKDGYLTQNQLISLFINDDSVKLLQEKGFEVKKYGRTHLSNKIRKLINDKKIPAPKVGDDGVRYFPIENIQNILKELVKLLQK